MPMMFQTDTERTLFLSQREARWGSAMEHAASTDIGIWGDEQSLYNDCVLIFSLELRGIGKPSSVLAISRCPHFQAAYATARQGPDSALRDALKVIALNKNNEDLLQAVLQEPESSLKGVDPAEYLARVYFSPRQLEQAGLRRLGEGTSAEEVPGA